MLQSKHLAHCVTQKAPCVAVRDETAKIDSNPNKLFIAVKLIVITESYSISSVQI